MYLIEKMNKGHYSIPKGHVEHNETEIETAIREIKEETNIDVEIDSNFRYLISYYPYENCLKDVVFFIAKATSSNVIKQDAEVSEILWLDEKEVIIYLTHTSDKEMMKAVIEYLSK